MKKLVLFCTFAMAVFCLAAPLSGCGGGDNNGNTDVIDPGDDEDPDPDKDALSIQFTSKTISLPTVNFPAVDVTSTEFILLEGKYQAKLNGVQFNGDDFAQGVVLPEDGEITIEQGGEELISFTPKTGGAGTKIKIGGIGSTSALASVAGEGRGIYTLKIPEGASDVNGYLLKYDVFTEGIVANLVQSVQLEGGVVYKMRRENQTGDKAPEGWARNPKNMTSGMEMTSTQQFSVYLESEADKAIDAQVPIFTAKPNGAGSNTAFVMQRFERVSDEEADEYRFFIYGNGDITLKLKPGKGLSSANYETTGKFNVATNADIYLRSFFPQATFKLYLLDNLDGMDQDNWLDDVATAEDDVYIAFTNASAGYDLPADKYLVMKVTDPQRVNTGENLAYAWKRTATSNPASLIRFEGMAFDAQNKCLIITGALTIRST